MNVRAVGRPRPEVVYAKRGWFAPKVSLLLVARPGQVADVPIDPSNEWRLAPRIVDGVVYSFQAEEKTIILTLQELEAMAEKFFALADGAEDYDEIELKVNGGSYGDRYVWIKRRSYSAVREALGPYRRAPVVAQGAYR